MKKSIALALALLLALAGCASLLERDYTVSSPHEEDPSPHWDAYRVETYPALRSALLSYVEEGMTEGRLRIPTTYPGNLTVDLEKAKRQLMEEEPLGCYSLSDITYHTSKIIAYYEADLSFTYKVPRDRLISLPKAATQADLTRLLTEALEGGEREVHLYLTACPEDGAAFCAAALDSAWDSLYAHGAGSAEAPEEAAVEDGEGAEDAAAERADRPTLRAEFYPQSGLRRVAVLTIAYPAPGEEETP